MKKVKIFGPPGTGKTTTLIKIGMEKIKSGIPFDDICLLSYTNAGADEARERMKKAAGITDDRKGWFTTIHSACLRLMQMEGVYVGKQIFSPWKHGKEFCNLAGLKPPSNEDEVQEGGQIGTGAAFFATHSWLVNQFKGPSEWRDCPQAEMLIANNMDYEDLLKSYDEFKETKALFDFEDILLDAWAMKVTIPVKILIVDEFQDISPLQKALVVNFEGGDGIQEVYVAGDDDQALYSFQGSDPKLMLQYPVDEIKVLEKSWRCCNQVWDAAQELILKNVNRQEKVTTSAGTTGQVKYLSHVNIYDLVHEIQGKTYFLMRTNYQLSKLAWKMSDAHTLFKYLQEDKEEKWGWTKDRVRIMNYINKCDYRRRYACFEKIAKDEGWKYGQIAFLKGYLNQPPIVPENINVFLGTIHSSKGREADTVILFDDITQRVQKNLEINPEEERRIFFVGMTRAKTKLVIVHQFFGTQSLTFGEIAKKEEVPQRKFWMDSKGVRHYL